MITFITEKLHPIKLFPTRATNTPRTLFCIFGLAPPYKDPVFIVVFQRRRGSFESCFSCKDPSQKKMRRLLLFVYVTAAFRNSFLENASVSSEGLFRSDFVRRIRDNPQPCFVDSPLLPKILQNPKILQHAAVAALQNPPPSTQIRLRLKGGGRISRARAAATAKPPRSGEREASAGGVRKQRRFVKQPRSPQGAPPPPRKPKKQIYREIMAKSKAARAERKRTKANYAAMLEELDADFRAHRHLFQPFIRKDLRHDAVVDPEARPENAAGKTSNDAGFP